jgi:hypothetical protein
MNDTLKLVLAQTGGALLVPAKKVAQLICVEIQTIRNNKNCLRVTNRNGQEYVLQGGRYGSRIFFKAEHIAEYLDFRQARTAAAPLTSPPKRGRPTKASLAGLHLGQAMHQHAV